MSLWPAVHALRQAEALAALGTVTGPTDAPPPANASEADVMVWMADYVERARAALRRAGEFVGTGHEALKARGVEIARRIKKGVDSILAEGKRFPERLHKAAGEVKEAAENLLKIPVAGFNAMTAIAVAIGLALVFGR